jgi:hypothetical protein
MSTISIYNCNVSHHEEIELRVGIATGQVVAGEDDEHISLVKVVLFLIFTLTICAG